MKTLLSKTTINLFFLTLVFSTYTASADNIKWTKGKVYHGFKLIKQKPINEFNAIGRVFKHVRTGARLLKIDTNDDNKCFTVAFKYLANDDTGVAHILEHASMESSQKYRVKNPMTLLLKGSLQSFMNAMTSNEFIMYPIASRNKKDFFNIMEVYLDMIFRPLVYKEKNIFLQEGWRYELANKDQELTYNGIVYNEMKGYYSSPQQILYDHILKNLLPNTSYAHNYGGDPEFIPELSHQKLLAFHKKYFHPSNSYFILYGDGDTLEELRFIHNNCLSRYKRKNIRPVIPIQKPFKKIRDVTIDYAVGKTEDTKDKTLLSLSFAIGGALQPELTMAMGVLADLLVNLPDSPLRKALNKAGIGKEVKGGYDDSKQGVFLITIDNANHEDKEKFRKIVFDTLHEIVKSGLDKKQIEGALNSLEFRLREADFGRFPKGLVVTFNSVRGWMIGNDPFLTMEWEKPLKRIRTALESDYFEKIIQKHILKNTHALLLTLQPKPGLTEEIEQKTKQKLARIKASMSDAKLQALIKQTEDLKKWQTAPDKPEDIQKIPMLSIQDINPKAENLPVAKKQIGDTQVLHFSTPTNGIIYLQIMFDASGVPQEMIPQLSLLTEMLGKLSTKNHTFGDLNSEINIHTGGIYISPAIISDFKNPDHFMHRLVVQGKALTGKLDKLLDLKTEIVRATQYNDIQRIKQVITSLDSNLQNQSRANGYGLALQRLLSQLSPQGIYYELSQGLSFVHLVSKLAKQLDNRSDDLIADMEMIASLVFNKNNLIVGITCSEEDYQTFEQQFPRFLSQFKNQPVVTQTLPSVAKPANEALLSPSKVQYVIKGANFRKLGYTYTGRLNLLSNILSWDYLTSKIRIEGGAYGSWLSFNPEGLVVMSSYRDPKVVETLQVYDQMADFVRNFKANKQEMTRYIIGSIAKLDKPMTPSLKGSSAIGYCLKNITLEDRQKERDELLNTNQQDINQLAKMISDITTHANYCIYGNEEKLKTHQNLFDNLVEVVE